MAHHTKKAKQDCKEEVHTIEWCEPCYAVICTTCQDNDCTLLAVINKMGLKRYNPAPNPYGIDYLL